MDNLEALGEALSWLHRKPYDCDRTDCPKCKDVVDIRDIFMQQQEKLSDARMDAVAWELDCVGAEGARDHAEKEMAKRPTLGEVREMLIKVQNRSLAMPQEREEWADAILKERGYEA